MDYMDLTISLTLFLLGETMTWKQNSFHFVGTYIAQWSTVDDQIIIVSYWYEMTWGNCIQ